MGWLEVEVAREEMDTAAAAVFGDLEGDTGRVRKIQARDEEREWKRYGQGGVLSQRPSAGEQTEYQFEREDQFWQSNRIRKSVDPSSHCLPFCPLHTHLFTVISHLSIPKLSSHFLSPFQLLSPRNNLFSTYSSAPTSGQLPSFVHFTEKNCVTVKSITHILKHV